MVLSGAQAPLIRLNAPGQAGDRELLSTKEVRRDSDCAEADAARK